MRKDLRKKFKKYLESKSALCIYMKMYRERHLAVNPARLEDFLEQTTPNLAIPGAFVYPSSKLSVYDRDFWLALHESAKDLCQKLSRMLCIKADYELLECKMVSKNLNMIIFKLDTKQ